MEEMFEIVQFQRKSGKKCPLNFLSEEAVKNVKKFHESFPMYQETPLQKMDVLAEVLGLGAIYVKDESYRFGLNAFKVLGGSYAIGMMSVKSGTGHTLHQRLERRWLLQYRK